ncbi:hypothetical protein EDD18DRAFT_1152018 [Armillaria luteobubalina]|uniref:Protein phosphatase inhibitor 2 (IPP-2) n=1 Tax=Armillaria luteobubalina TaxID=153913 RepID=A0AA39UVS4_9AGAR|nr:hypothetical protein EDD18DRAFT_1152018 [Armillaria luteobubalina]
MSAEIIEDPPHLAPLPRSASNPKPKGILKNAPPQPGAKEHSLQWDEANIALTEIQKDSLMKITEPKTPYVRYNAETDEIEGDIPDLDLNGRYMSASPARSVSPTGADASGPSSRRTSFSSTGRPSSGRSASTASSRSTSFNLSDEARSGIREDGRGRDPGSEVELDEEMDEETAAKHAAFVRARGRHYSNEAEAMKRAARLMAEEDDDNVDGDDDASVSEDHSVPPIPPLSAKLNGIDH